MDPPTEHPSEQAAAPSDVVPLAAELAQQAAQQHAQQEAEDEQLPPTIGEANIEDEGPGDIAPESAGPADDDVVPHRAESGEPAAHITGDYDETNLFSMKPQKAAAAAAEQTRKKNIRRRGADEPAARTEAQTPMDLGADEDGGMGFSNEDPAARRRRLLEEKMDLAVKARTAKRRRADEDDLERMQDDRIDYLKNKMIEAANMDVDKNLQGQIATEKLKLLREVMDTLAKADLAILILDNNLLEAVRLWLEPLPDASMPAYQIQKDLLLLLASLPIKTDHLVASGIGKVLVFYQRSSRTEPNLKKIVDRLIGEWTRPILNKLDSYKDRTIRFNDYNKARFSNKLALQRAKPAEPKSLYEQQAERRNRAAIPSARTTAYKIAPRVDPSLLMRLQRGSGEMFTRINRKMTNSKKKVVKKSGPSIEGKNLSM
ncbi:hypothetical protein METBIDRAFT_116957 [Metschnikowia bicuspidata var. bicuspidata NRRL YB-4993]|uniref:TFIIS N-terminal domain-containing protein n=1 Tax=Metschnikowia bicuspidata var. bicuspidata NRRL YB-4993 TaxID=869754 RepID=A0A1A0HJK4_9ASCO|nr:hypothetical protein METBIDRAFT_116957 [Metschnikowia bicuspidata var. bicuspidata NRRL YB-4993]OBA24067.1 hypothetical protein METBIDRAFT_116957 [Metschnikowia bicuspidata var. bicuspidata NRRL YB-4993]